MSLVHPDEHDPFTAALTSERKRLTQLCAQLTGDADVADDLAQETLIEAWRLRDRLRDPAGISAWLAAIARNLCLRSRRAHGYESSRIAPLAAMSHGADAASSLEIPDALDLEVELERDELAALLDRALALLPPETRSILVQRYIDESPHAEIAARLGMSENAVAVRLYRGRLAFQRILATELRDDAVTYGLVTEHPDEWQPTRIWCPRCGQQRLTGCFDRERGEFSLRCAACCTEPGAFITDVRARRRLQGVKGFKAALNRVDTWMRDYVRRAMPSGSVSCEHCGRTATLVPYLPPDGPPLLRDSYGAHLRCESCGDRSYVSLGGLINDAPAVRRFIRDHPRVRTLPEREIEHAGRAALVTRIERVTHDAGVDVISTRDTYEVLDVFTTHGC